MWGKEETTIVWDDEINESTVLKKEELKSIDYMDRHRNNTVTEERFEINMNMGDYLEPNVARIDLSKGAADHSDRDIQTVNMSNLADNRGSMVRVSLNLVGLLVSAGVVVYGLPWAFGAFQESLTNILNSGLMP